MEAMDGEQFPNSIVHLHAARQSLVNFMNSLRAPTPVFMDDPPSYSLPFLLFFPKILNLSLKSSNGFIKSFTLPFYAFRHHWYPSPPSSFLNTQSDRFLKEPEHLQESDCVDTI